MSASPQLDPIDTFCIGEADNIRSLRKRIHKCTGASVSRAKAATNPIARQLYWDAAQEAGAWTFRPACEEDLSDAIRALSCMFLAAGIFENLEVPNGD